MQHALPCLLMHTLSTETSPPIEGKASQTRAGWTPPYTTDTLPPRWPREATGTQPKGWVLS